MAGYLDSPTDVIRGLITYMDWWQPSSTSVLQVGPARRSYGIGDGIRTGLLERLDERVELGRRMRVLDEMDRRLLYLWYVAQTPAATIADVLGISRRQCFRRRASAIKRIVEFDGRPDS
jgi:hypothetical protein